MDDEQQGAQYSLKQLEIAIAAWLVGEITDDELVKLIRECPKYGVLQKSGLSDTFDSLSQVNCVRELMSTTVVGADSVDLVRCYAYACWKDYIDGRYTDVYGIFPELK